MRLLPVAVALALSAGPALAQMPNVNLIPEIQHKTPEEKAAEAERDKAYRESLKKIPDSKSSDPWGGVRTAPAAAPTANAAKPKPKAGSASN